MVSSMGESLLCINARTFIINFFSAYLEKRDFDAVKSMLHENISWFGTGEQEICRSYDDAIALLTAEQNSFESSFVLDYGFICANQISDNAALVYGTMNAIEAVHGEIRIPITINARFTTLCISENDTFKLFTCHFSMPNSAQDETEFVHQHIVEQYNNQLKEQLDERTHMLAEKTLMLEALANNITGGVQICRLDEFFTIEYVSDGFEKMTGYTRAELLEIHENKHTNLIYPPDLIELKEQIRVALREGNHFSAVHRIVRKDASLIWVLDNGVFLTGNDGFERTQSILTDITLQKEQERALQISEIRYQIALQSSDLSMFEYNIKTKELIFFNGLSSMYNLPDVVADGPETLISRGTIEPSSAPAYREMYKKIHAGVPSASCYITTTDANGDMHDYELTLTSIFDDDKKPIRAIGVRKNISAIMRLRKEREFGQTLVAGRCFVFEANFDTDQITDINESWKAANNLDKVTTVSQLIDIISQVIISPEYSERFRQKMAPEYLIYKFGKGEKLVSFFYKCVFGSNDYVWHEATVNMLKDEQTGNLLARFYYDDISDRKNKEERAYEEQQIYEAMTKQAALVYEVNITKNLAISGHDSWGAQYDIAQSDDYTDMIEAFAKHAIHPDDVSTFKKAFKRDNVLKCFYNGKRQFDIEYRKRDRNSDGEYRWAHGTFHLYESPETGDVKGFYYSEDIDKQKNRQITLEYNATHDLMTDLYNKVTTEQKINDFLSAKANKKGHHALLMIDLDWFKSVNDRFGHIYGDNLLNAMSDRLRNLFRESDIVGRIGGDEFCALLKNLDSTETAAKKANDVCQKLREPFTYDGKECTLSASVGIAIFPQNGKTYDVLYNNADIALYNSKKAGRNQYSIIE